MRHRAYQYLNDIMKTSKRKISYEYYYMILYYQALNT